MTNDDTHDLIRTIARDEIAKAFAAHVTLCPLVREDIPSRVRTVENRVSTMWGYMVGSGIISGASVAAAQWLTG